MIEYTWMPMRAPARDSRAGGAVLACSPASLFVRCEFGAKDNPGSVFVFNFSRGGAGLLSRVAFAIRMGCERKRWAHGAGVACLAVSWLVMRAVKTAMKKVMT